MPPQGLRSRIAQVWRRDIWKTTLVSDHSPRGLAYAFLRVVSITGSTFSQTKAASRAADLSFSSLLGLGPLVAIAMLVASTIFGGRNPHLAVDLLQRLLSFVAPQLNQYDAVNPESEVLVNPDLVALINGFIKGARSSTVGVVGAVTLVLIVLFLFKSIEDVFNEIWGVRRGRTILMRFVFYWTLLTLGGILFFAVVLLVGAGPFWNGVISRLSFGFEINHMLQLALPVFSFGLMVAILACFYRAIPNTRVWWRAALAGAVVVAALLVANNYLQFLYLRRVLLTKSLFGSLGIIPVLMFGLYVFWLIVLVGGHISYAIQHVDARNSKLGWAQLSAINRERLSLAVLMAICRRAHEGRPPIAASELAGLVKLPAQVLNECLNLIIDLGFVALAPAGRPGDPQEAAYLPARPLGEITLLKFKNAADHHGADPVGDSVGWSDPIVKGFGEALDDVGKEAFFGRSVEALLAEEAAAK